MLGSWREPLLHRRTVRPSDGLNRREYLQPSNRGRLLRLPRRLLLQGGGLITRRPQPQDLGPGWPRQMLGRLVFHSSSPSCRKRQSWRRWRLGHTRVWWIHASHTMRPCGGAAPRWRNFHISALRIGPLIHLQLEICSSWKSQECSPTPISTAPSGVRQNAGRRHSFSIFGSRVSAILARACGRFYLLGTLRIVVVVVVPCLACLVTQPHVSLQSAFEGSRASNQGPP